jgi:hypothetical protein
MLMPSRATFVYERGSQHRLDLRPLHSSSVVVVLLVERVALAPHV